MRDRKGRGSTLPGPRTRVRIVRRREAGAEKRSNSAVSLRDRLPQRRDIQQFVLLHALGISITVATLLFDIFIPLHVAAAVPYALLVLLSLRDPGRGLTWFAAISATVLTILGYQFTPAGSWIGEVLANRLLALFVIWVTAYLVFEQKRRALELERERMARAQSEKLASLGEMAAGIAHELGNPLAALQGRVELLETKLGSDLVASEDVGRFVSIATELTERMVRIIRGMRSLARDASSDPFQNAQMARVIDDVLELSREKLRRRDIELRLTPVDEDLWIPCREAQINQVMVNLIGNAVDAVSDLSERWIQLDVTATESTLEIWVTDSGKGIPESIRGRVMEPFFTTKDVGKGTGLGLSISESIVEAHSGKLEIDEACPNTRFVVSLPRKQRLTC